MGEEKKPPVLLKDLPEEIQDFLWSADVFDVLDRLREKYLFEEKAEAELLGLLEDVTVGRAAWTGLPGLLEERIGIRGEFSTRMAIDLAGYRLLPLSDFLGDVAGQIRVWGGDPAVFRSVQKVEIRAFQPEQMTKEILKDLRVHLTDAVSEHRLETIFASFVRREKGQEEIAEALCHPVKLGGLALSPGAAGKLVAAFFERLEKNPWWKASRISPVVPVVAVPPRALPTEDKQKREKKEDEEEMFRFVEMLKKTDVARGLPLDEAVAEIQKQASLVLETEAISRFRAAVEARLREVRTPVQTREQLEKSRGSGGVGLTGTVLAQTMEALEQVFEAWQRVETERLAKGRRTRTEEIARTREERDAFVKKEEALLSRRFAERTGTIPKESVSPAAPSLARVTASHNIKEELKRQEANIDSVRVKQAVVQASARPESAPPPISKVSLPNRMEDVRTIRRPLAGPMEEIGRMTLTEFRRLSGDPAEASLKVKDKIDLLSEEGYQKRVEAVQAWRASPLYTAYRRVVERSLSEGVSLEKAAEKFDVPDMPTPAEVRCLASLNASLRF
ncbi:MAG TPA: hypothetical protein VJB99_03785 [Patescibacteria group bacterium]|nr:hypothetical protein [Patescibacteria group bacterium]